MVEPEKLGLLMKNSNCLLVSEEEGWLIVCCLTAPLASLPPISSPISQEESGKVHSVALNLPFYQTLLLLLLLHLKLLLLLLLLIHIPPHEQIEVASKEVEELLHSNNRFPITAEQTTHPSSPFSTLEKWN